MCSVFTLACIACFVSTCILVAPHFPLQLELLDLRKPEQVTGILGFKAYLCLDRSRVVGTVLAVIQIVWLAVAVRDATVIDSERQLSGEVFHA